VDTAVERYELDPLPRVDLQMGRHDMLHVSVSRELNELSTRRDLRVGIRVGLLDRLGRGLRFDPTPY
jgi:hypothetical protein